MREMVEKIENVRYTSADGWAMAREEGPIPNGNQFNGAWVLRDARGAYVDHDRYRFDLEGRHNLSLKH